MKYRKGWVSNSSTSSFIIPSTYDKDEILTFVKATLVNETIKKIERIEADIKSGKPTWSNAKEYIERLRYEMTPAFLDQHIKVATVKAYNDEWADLYEWIEHGGFSEDDWVLYDTDDNVINWIEEEIVARYKVIDYCTHMG